MKLNKKHLLLLYFMTFTLFSIHFWVNTTECEAYYMHDDSIEISAEKLITNSFILFLVPAVILLFSEILKLKGSSTLFLIHYSIALISLGLLTIAINKPCDFINGGHYMFIDFLMTVLSYILKLLSYITLGLLSIKTFINIIDLYKARRSL